MVEAGAAGWTDIVNLDITDGIPAGDAGWAGRLLINFLISKIDKEKENFFKGSF